MHEQQDKCPLTGVVLDERYSECEDCQYPGCNHAVRRMQDQEQPIAPPQEIQGSTGTGSGIEGEADSRHSDSEASKLDQAISKLDGLLIGHTIDYKIGADFEREFWDVLGLMCEFRNELSQKTTSIEESFGSIITILEKFLDQNKLHVSIVEGDQGQKFIIISQMHVPVSGSYLEYRRPRRKELT